MTQPADDLSLETGGPTWRLWMRTGMAPAQPKPLGRRALLLAAVCWLPPFLFSLRDGLAFGDSIAVPFVRDFVPYARAILGVIFLVLADASVGNRMRRVLQQFHQAKLLQPGAIPAFAAVVGAARRRVDSTSIELGLLVLAYVGAASAARRGFSHETSTWFVLVTPEAKSLTLAGWWWLLISAPILYFLFLRWAFRGIVWAQLLAKVSRLDLRLIASHPDRAGGLGFLSLGQAGFAVLVLTASTSLCAALADEVVYHGSALESHYVTLGAFAAIAVLIVLAPLVAFAPRLAALKREALYAYGSLSSRHDSAFADKWIGVPTPAESLLGHEDASSLADLVTAYQRAKDMRPVPIDFAAITPLVIAAALPMIPLLTTKVPLAEILKGLVKVIM